MINDLIENMKKALSENPDLSSRILDRRNVTTKVIPNKTRPETDTEYEKRVNRSSRVLADSKERRVKEEAKKKLILLGKLERFQDVIVKAEYYLNDREAKVFISGMYLSKAIMMDSGKEIEDAISEVDETLFEDCFAMTLRNILQYKA